METKRYPDYLYYSAADVNREPDVPDFHFEDSAISNVASCVDETAISSVNSKITPCAAVFPHLIRPEFCDRMLQHFRKIETDPVFVARRNHGIDLMHIECMHRFANNFRDYIMPKVDMTLSVYKYLQVKHIFGLQYLSGESHPLHTDDCDISVNICFEHVAEASNCASSGGELELWLDLSNIDPQNHIRIPPQKGSCIIHSGSSPHFAYPMVNSYRYNIIIWYEMIAERQKPVEVTQNCYLLQLPQELLESILIHLSVPELLMGILLTCKSFSSVLNSTAFWEKILYKDFSGGCTNQIIENYIVPEGMKVRSSCFDTEVAHLISKYRSLKRDQYAKNEKAKNLAEIEKELYATELTTVENMNSTIESLLALRNINEQHKSKDIAKLIVFMLFIFKPIWKCHQAILNEIKFITLLPSGLHDWTRIPLLIRNWLQYYKYYAAVYPDIQLNIDKCYGDIVQYLGQNESSKLQVTALTPVKRIPRFQLILKDMDRFTEDRYQHDLTTQSVAMLEDCMASIDRCRRY